MIQIKASEFGTRVELEEYVRKISDRNGYEIHGTSEELRRLQLSPRVLVYGVSVIASDYVPPPIVPKAKRGEIKDSGLSGQNTNLKAKKRVQTTPKARK